MPGFLASAIFKGTKVFCVAGFRLNGWINLPAKSKNMATLFFNTANGLKYLV